MVPFVSPLISSDLSRAGDKCKIDNMRKRRGEERRGEERRGEERRGEERREEERREEKRREERMVMCCVCLRVCVVLRRAAWYCVVLRVSACFCVFLRGAA